MDTKYHTISADMAIGCRATLIKYKKQLGKPATSVIGNGAPITIRAPDSGPQLND